MGETDGRGWADFPLERKFFAAGEAPARLDHLEIRGRVCRREERGNTAVMRQSKGVS